MKKTRWTGMRRSGLMLALVGLGVATPAWAQKDDEKKPDHRALELGTETAVTHHSVTVDGRELKYTATAGYMPLPNYQGEPRADVFFIAYTLDGVEDVAKRPLTFSFNGGPGSSSVWLHLGTLGPRRVDLGEEGMSGRPPYELVDNPETWLDLTDMVFIDPVGTGYSRPLEGVRNSEFHGLQEDIRSVGDFIRLWTTRNERWSSPKFLVGESYGTTRAAGLSGYLQDTHGMYLNGILLVSPVLNFQTIRFNVGNDLPYWMFLPTYTATAFYHGKLSERLSADLERTLEEARRFAESDYLVALAKGDRLGAAERDRIATRVAELTGLSKRFVLDSDLRINIFNFTKELLRDEGRTVGRLDSRFKGIDRLDIGDGYDYDPSYSAIQGPYTATLNDYVRRELGYKNDLPYEILTGRVHPWSYGSDENRYANVGETLRSAMSKNADLHVLVACGYYDLATPFFAAEYTVEHLGLDPERRGNVRLTYYPSGHMMYIRVADLVKLKDDAAAFYRDALAR
ncbi:MAG: S10 family peptidase [Phycisphaerales bacterium JB037]